MGFSPGHLSSFPSSTSSTRGEQRPGLVWGNGEAHQAGNRPPQGWLGRRVLRGTISSPSGHLWATCPPRRDVVPGEGQSRGTPALGSAEWARRLLLKPPKIERPWVQTSLERVRAQICHFSAGLSS